jgi:hypothetical protein
MFRVRKLLHIANGFVKKVCVHCQASTKFIAEMGRRVSSVSDANQFHNFEDDHWFLWLFI